MMTIKEAAGKWEISTRRILKLCGEGRIPGAVKDAKWLIPADAEKPEDKRVKTGAYMNYSQPTSFSSVGWSFYAGTSCQSP